MTRLRRLVRPIAVVIVLLVVGGTSSAVRAPAEPPDLLAASFAQLDWHAVDGLSVATDTSWGAFDYTYELPPEQTAFVNLLAGAPDGPSSWVIQNLPLFPDTDTGQPIEVRAFFDLSELGVSAGEPLASVCYTATIDASLRTSPPAPPSTCVAVADEDIIPGDAPELAGAGPVDPGAPVPIKLADEPKNLGPKRKQPFDGVQEGDKQCTAGALARSLDWLNRERKLGSTKKAQDFYNDLVAAGVTRVGPGSAAQTEGDRIAAKVRYVQREFSGRIVTKTWDPGANVNSPTGVKESNKDFGEWLKREWPTEDVEIAFKGAGVAHIVTLTSVAEDKNGNFKIKYRDDEAQGGPPKDGQGDKKEKDGQIFKQGNTWYFGNTNFPLELAISESVKKKKPPKTTTSSSSSSTSTTSTSTTSTSTTSTPPPGTTSSPPET